MKFSVLMSVYEKENPEYLRLSLESILVHQTVIPTEVILVEDGPLNDGLYSVLEEFKTQFAFFKTIPLEKNVGLGIALNEGLKHCSHEWVARMDSDDIAVRDRFEKQIAFVEKNPDIDVIGGHISEFGDVISDIRAIKKMPLLHEEIIKMARRRTPMSHVTVMFKKAAVLSVGNYQSLLYAEDYYLWVRMIVKKYTFANLDEILVHVRVGNGMYARRGNKRQIESWKILNRYMVKERLVNQVDYFINMISIRLFVYLPVSIKEIIYKKVLRK